MISIERCRKYLKERDYSDEETQKIRDSLYQLGEMLFDEFIHKKNTKTSRKK